MDEDKLIDELVDLIEHEPAIGRNCGVSKTEHEAYIQKVFEIIEQLEKAT